jgi:hypothetical protein
MIALPSSCCRPIWVVARANVSRRPGDHAVRASCRWCEGGGGGGVPFSRSNMSATDCVQERPAIHARRTGGLTTMIRTASWTVAFAGFSAYRMGSRRFDMATSSMYALLHPHYLATGT